MINGIFQSLKLDLVNNNVYAKFYQNIPKGSRESLGLHLDVLENNSSQCSTWFKRQSHFHFFRILSSAKPRPMINVILQSLGLDLVNINSVADKILVIWNI